MNLSSEYVSLFGQKVLDIIQPISQIDTFFDDILGKLPSFFSIENTVTGKVYEIDLIKDPAISQAEFSILYAMLTNYSSKGLNITCGDGVPFPQLVESTPGLSRLLKAILFLDFYSPNDFLNNVISVQDFIPIPKLIPLPSSEKKDIFLNMKKGLMDKISDYQNNYNRLMVEYEKCSQAITTLQSVVAQVTVELSKFGAQQAPVIENFDSMQQRSRKISRIIQAMGTRMERNKSRILEILNLGYIDSKAHTLTEKLKSINARYQTAKEILSGEQGNLLVFIETESRKSQIAAMNQEQYNEYATKLAQVNSTISQHEQLKLALNSQISDLKDKSNRLQIEVNEIEARMQIECKPINMDKLISENILELEKPQLLAEKINRFLLYYMSKVSSSKYLDLQQRRAFIDRLFPDLKIKSLNPTPVTLDDKYFIAVQ